MADYTLLKFEADWCHPCKLTSRALDVALRGHSANTFEIVTIDIADDSLTATQYQVSALPTVVVLDAEQEEIARHIGSLTPPQARFLLRSLLNAETIQ